MTQAICRHEQAEAGRGGHGAGRGGAWGGHGRSAVVQ